MRRDFLYMKVNRKVSEFLGQTKWRPVLADGNYLAYIPDIKARIDRDFLAHPEETAAAIGGVLLSDREAAEEQNGIKNRPLPVATDPRFVIDAGPEEETGGTDPDGGDSPAEEEADEEAFQESPEEGGEA